jgi:hypothetical protein
MFSEFQCPFCAKFAANIFPELTTKYVDTGRVLVSFRHFPLEQIHPQALQAAQAAECAHLQGRFAKMHDLLFEVSPRLQSDGWKTLAKTAELVESDFRLCMDAAMPAVRGGRRSGPIAQSNWDTNLLHRGARLQRFRSRKETILWSTTSAGVQ